MLRTANADGGTSKPRTATDLIGQWPFGVVRRRYAVLSAGPAGPTLTPGGGLPTERV
jgi:hypothetical protein